MTDWFPYSLAELRACYVQRGERASSVIRHRYLSSPAIVATGAHEELHLGTSRRKQKNGQGK